MLKQGLKETPRRKAHHATNHMKLSMGRDSNEMACLSGENDAILEASITRGPEQFAEIFLNELHGQFVVLLLLSDLRPGQHSEPAGIHCTELAYALTHSQTDLGGGVGASTQKSSYETTGKLIGLRGKREEGSESE